MRREHCHAAEATLRNALANASSKLDRQSKENANLREVLALSKFQGEGTNDELEKRLEAVRRSLVQQAADCQAVCKDMHFTTHTRQ